MSELDPHGTLPRLAPCRTWPGSLVLFTLIVAYVGGLVTWNSNTPPGEPVTPDVRIAAISGMVQVLSATAPWSCVSDAKGHVQGVMFTGEEGDRVP